MTGDGTLDYTYDAWNRQVAVRRASDSSLAAAYSFDGTNRRITKTLADATTTDYFYNQKWQVVEERTRDASGTLTSTNQYVWDQSYIDSPVVRFQTANGSTQALYYAWDADHNVTATIDATGSVVGRYAYDAYGNTRAYSPTWTNPAAPTESGPLYCGYFFDAETGNYLARNRFYSVTLATWLSRDPIASTTNLYCYCGDSPTDKTDPSGKECRIATRCGPARLSGVPLGTHCGLMVHDDQGTYALDGSGGLTNTFNVEEPPIPWGTTSAFTDFPDSVCACLEKQRHGGIA